MLSPVTSIFTRKPKAAANLDRFLSKNIAPNFFRLRKLLLFGLKYALDEGGHYLDRRLSSVDMDCFAESCSVYEKDADGRLRFFSGPHSNVAWGKSCDRAKWKKNKRKLKRKPGEQSRDYRERRKKYEKLLEEHPSKTLPPTTTSLFSALNLIRSPITTLLDSFWDYIQYGVVTQTTDFPFFSVMPENLLAQAFLEEGDGFSGKMKVDKKIMKERVAEYFFGKIDPASLSEGADVSEEITKIKNRRERYLDTFYVLFPFFIRFVSFVSSVVMMNNYCKRVWRNHLLTNRRELRELLQDYEAAKAARDQVRIKAMEEKLSHFVAEGYKGIGSFKGVAQWVWSNIKGGIVSVAAIGATAGIGYLLHKHNNKKSGI